MDLKTAFDMTGRVVVITGGGGLLGSRHAEAIIEMGGIPILLDCNEKALYVTNERISAKYEKVSMEMCFVDITDKEALKENRDMLLKKYGHVDGLINNAANNPKVEDSSTNMKPIQFENFPLSIWNEDIAVGLTGAFLCAQVYGEAMAKTGKGVILNIASDLGVIAPDQRIYRKQGIPDDEQIVKPVSYSVIKHGIIGLTKYLATYYAEKGIRSNALCPAGVFNGQDEEFLTMYTKLLPMGRMADVEEYKGTIAYLMSDASSFMTGSTVIVDGGRTCW